MRIFSVSPEREVEVLARLEGLNAAAIDSLLAETRNRIADHRQRQARDDAAREAKEARWLELGRELKAAQQGAALGAQFARDPYRAAQALGTPVRRVDGLRNWDGTPILGRFLKPPFNLIQLEARQGPHEERRTLAHEIGHQQGFLDERNADVFMRAFLDEQGTTPAPGLP